MGLIVLITMGTALGLTAGGVQGLRDIDGVYPGDYYRLLFWRTTPRETATAALRILATVLLQIISGAVGFLSWSALTLGHHAAVHSVRWLNHRAAHVSRDLTFTPEVPRG